jgi:hypothetical protein
MYLGFHSGDISGSSVCVKLAVPSFPVRILHLIHSPLITFSGDAPIEPDTQHFRIFPCVAVFTRRCLLPRLPDQQWLSFIVLLVYDHHPMCESLGTINGSVGTAIISPEGGIKLEFELDKSWTVS